MKRRPKSIIHPQGLGMRDVTIQSIHIWIFRSQHIFVPAMYSVATSPPSSHKTQSPLKRYANGCRDVSLHCWFDVLGETRNAGCSIIMNGFGHKARERCSQAHSDGMIGEAGRIQVPPTSYICTSAVFYSSGMNNIEDQ